MGRKFDMLNTEELNEIKDWLEKSQNPVFFFDNDTDGLVSFLLLQRYLGRGKGVAIKSFPDLGQGYSRKINELKPDVIFILDKPLVDKSFIEEARLQNIPVVWIDHHPLQEMEGVYYYNPLKGKILSSEPVSYWCYKAVKQDLWLATAGCISDWFVPDFIEDFRKKYPDLISDKNTPEEILYETELGKFVAILNFALKDTVTNVLKMIRLLEKAKDPHEILSEEAKYAPIIERYNYLNKKFEKFFEKANELAEKSHKFVFFRYAAGEIKFTAELANKLAYKWPKKLIAVASIQGEKVNISFRGDRARLYVEKALEKVDGRGGGHEKACAASIKADDIEKFIHEIEKQL